jgi:hypothetical protein
MPSFAKHNSHKPCEHHNKIVFFNGFPFNDGFVVMEILQGVVETQYACSSKYPSC